MPDKISQENAEVFVVPDTQKAKVSQEVVEAFVVPSGQKAKVSAESVEVFIQGAVGGGAVGMSWGQVIG